MSCFYQAADAASRLAEGEDPDAAQLPPGTVEFNIQPPQLTAALAEDSLAVDAAPDIDVPDALLPPERLDELMSQRQPAYVPLPGAAAVSCLPYHAAGCPVHLCIRRSVSTRPIVGDGMLGYFTGGQRTGPSHWRSAPAAEQRHQGQLPPHGQ